MVGNSLLNLLYPPPPQRPSPEIEVLLLCSQNHLSEAHLRKLHALTGEPLDWRAVAELALEHKVFPLVFSNLQRHVANCVPSDVLQDLQRLHLKNLMFNMRAQVETNRVVKAFEASGVKVLLFKGPVLDTMLYGGKALREFKDIDLLVQPTDVALAQKSLENLSYLPLTTGNGVVAKNGHDGNKGIFHRSFVQPQYQLEVELHWAFGSALAPDPMDRQNYWENAQAFATDTLHTHTLTVDDLLLMLCMHGAKHRWHRLKWLCDIAEFCRTFPDFDWVKFLQKADALGMKRVVLLNLWLVQHFFEVNLASPIQRSIRQTPYVQPLGRYVARWIFSQSDRGVTAQLRLIVYSLLKHESFSNRLPYVVHTLRHERSEEGRSIILLVMGVTISIVSLLTVLCLRLIRRFRG